MPTISADRKITTLINTYTVSPMRQRELVKLLEKGSESVTKKQLGFISESIHKGLDGTKVASYSQWRSLGHIKRMQQNRDMRVFMEKVEDLVDSYEPISYEVQATSGSSSVDTFIMFSKNAEEAVKFYCTLFQDSKITNVTRFTEQEIQELARLPEEQRPGKAGEVKTITFELLGQKFTAGNGGSSFNFNHSFSFSVSCETQKELDRIWNALADGGRIEECGWVIDHFGVPWQVQPAKLNDWLSDHRSGKAAAVASAILRLKKLDFAILERVYETGVLPLNENLRGHRAHHSSRPDSPIILH